MSLWKQFILVFSVTTVLRVALIVGSTGLLVFAIQSGDTGLILFAIFVAFMAYLWSLLNFLQNFLGKFYIVPEHFLHQTEKAIDHVEKLKEIVEMPESTTKEALKEAYFEVIQETLEYMKGLLK
jgi:hypothetical protein